MSSSRGYFLGQIIDDLDAIAHQVENRARLGYLDLNRMLEDFFKDVLNIVLDADFKNLNETRSNEPGLDLGSEKLRMGIQVTSRATSEKVAKTLKNITTDQREAYTTIGILVIGDKQGSYTFDDTRAGEVGFKLENIWDITELCRRATSLSLVQLQELHRLVTAEVARVRVELELPRDDGSFPTDLSDYIEKVGRPTRTDGSTFLASDAAADHYDSAQDAAADLNALADALAPLPRISRQFLALIIEKSEDGNGFSRRTNDHLIRSISRYPNTEGELGFLDDRGFISYYSQEDTGKSACWAIVFPIKAKCSYFYECFFEFIDTQKVDLQRVIVNLDFSAFGPPPAEPASGD